MGKVMGAALATAATVTVAISLAPAASAAVHHVYPGSSIGGTVSSASPGDTVIVHGGSYPRQKIAKAFSSPVTVREATGETARVAGFEFANPSSNLNLQGFDIDPGDSVQGILFSPNVRDITVSDVKILSGKHGVRFTAGAKAGWPTNVTVRASEIRNALRDNVQVSGARNVLFENNWIHDPQVNGNHNDGIQSIASDGLKIRRNIFAFETPGPRGPNQGIILGRADPAQEGRTVVNSEVTNNLVYQWRGAGITIAGTTNTTVDNNTVWDGGGGSASAFVISAKNQPSVFGNTNVRLANNILNKMQLKNGGTRPAIESHNLVRTGGGGYALLTGDPQFTTGYRLKSTSPAINTANARYAPTVDRDKLPRDSQPDRGAYEYR